MSDGRPGSTYTGGRRGGRRFVTGDTALFPGLLPLLSRTCQKSASSPCTAHGLAHTSLTSQQNPEVGLGLTLPGARPRSPASSHMGRGKKSGAIQG
ncbi:unnamed protein product [Merluccius merluccius]